MNDTFSVIFLAGGQGQRFLSSTPKQFHLLHDKPIALHSFSVFCSMPQVQEIVVVCEQSYQKLFTSSHIPITFASPGKRRQDSVFNGFQALTSKTSLICIHDAARPFISPKLIQKVVQEGKHHGAAALAIPIKLTIKESTKNHFVKKTLPRSSLWEMQTPQILHKTILEKGFAVAKKQNLTLTDDISLAELVSHPPKLVLGENNNIKITTQQDLHFCQWLLKK